jgi:hypothetical protein
VWLLAVHRLPHLVTPITNVAETVVGKGMGAALAELLDGRAVRYNADAVDACIALFRDGRFKFTGAPEAGVRESPSRPPRAGSA